MKRSSKMTTDAAMPALTNDLRVLVVASSPLARAGLTSLLDGATGINIVGQSATTISPMRLTYIARMH